MRMKKKKEVRNRRFGRGKLKIIPIKKERVSG